MALLCDDDVIDGKDFRTIWRGRAGLGGDVMTCFGLALFLFLALFSFLSSLLGEGRDRGFLCICLCFFCMTS